MRILKRVSSLQRHLNIIKQAGRTIGFVPTMGALHGGHMSLIKKSTTENDVTVCSIFVNPTQFNQKEDLKKYPRNLEADAQLLHKFDCDYLFAPGEKQVYPRNLDLNVSLDISHLTQTMEGPNRPGHFEGVVQVVNRLLDIVDPQNLYMGQKDFQQFTIISYMIESLYLKTKLRVCPIIREDDGLAKSSRNVRLNPEIRPQCSIVYEALDYARKNLNEQSIAEIERAALKMLEKPNFKPEYFKIVNGYNLEKIRHAYDSNYVVACTAVWAGDVRLIDNMILKGEKNIR